MSRCWTVRLRRAVVPTGGMSSWGISGPFVTRREGAPECALPTTWSVGVDVDGDRDAVGDHVEDGGALAGLLDEALEHLGRRVALDRETHVDLLVTVANGRNEPQD